MVAVFFTFSMLHFSGETSKLDEEFRVLNEFWVGVTILFKGCFFFNRGRAHLKLPAENET